MVKFLFVVGPPGVGHMMFYSLMVNILDEKKVISAKILLQKGAAFKDSPELNKLLSNIWNPTLHAVPRSDYDHVKSRVRQEIQALTSAGCTHFLATHTFPYGHPYPKTPDGGNIPNLVELHGFMDDISDIKLLVMYRDPVAVTWSAIRRGFTKDLMLQAKIVERNFIYIVEQLKSCPKDNYKIMRYEDFFTKYDSCIDTVSNLWQLDKNAFVHDIKSPADVPAKEQKILEEFFTEERVEQWKFLYENID